MNNTGITVRSMRRADILDGVNQWLQSPADNNKMLTGHLHCAEIVTYRFDSYKDEDGWSRLYLALKTRRGDVEAAQVKFDVDKRNGTLYATIFCEDSLVRWHRRAIPSKILCVLTATEDAKKTQWRERMFVELEFERRDKKEGSAFLEKYFAAVDANPEFHNKFLFDTNFAKEWLANN